MDRLQWSLAPTRKTPLVMRTLSFYRLALLLPLAVPLALLPLDQSALVGVLMMSVLFGGAQYLVFAVGLSVWMGRVRHDRARMERRLFWAPPLFIPVQAIGWLLFALVQGTPGAILGALWLLLPFTLWCLVLGYAYVGAARLACAALRRLGWVRDTPWQQP